MPKELIRGQYLVSEPLTSDDPTPYLESGIELRWGREGSYVQVATGSIAATGFNNESAQYVDLSRQGINSLIRNLRKARDQAYGRDE